ncbi:MAG: histidine phosphatase family protein [Alphaproteobacteria bacterium]|nr:histidine phosphatase family protein [Alphaproteobacteria bacterium]
MSKDLVPAPQRGEVQPPGAGDTWIFVRHGESVANAENWLSGHVDTPLTERGRAQADELGRVLAPWRIARAVSSDLRRARETAERALTAWSSLTHHAPPRLDTTAALQERHTGAWAGRDRDELRAAGLLQRLTTWNDGPPGGESQAALAARVLPALAALEAEQLDGPTLVVAHGGVLRVVLGALDGIPQEDTGFFGVPNAAPLVRQVSAGFFTKAARALHSRLL